MISCPNSSLLPNRLSALFPGSTKAIVVQAQGPRIVIGDHNGGNRRQHPGKLSLVAIGRRIINILTKILWISAQTNGIHRGLLL